MRNAACSPCSSREQWRDRRDIGHGFRWKRLACCEVLFVPRRTRMVGRKEACRSEAIVHLFEIGGARQYVVARIKRVETETIANAEFNPGARHELHQAHRTTRRDRMLVASAFNLDDGANPARRHGKASGRLLDEFGEPIDGFRTRRGLCARARFEERRGRDQAHERRDRHDNARNRSERTEPCNRARQLTDMTFPLQAGRALSGCWTMAGKERSETVRRNRNQSRECECRA